MSEVVPFTHKDYKRQIDKVGFMALADKLSDWLTPRHTLIRRYRLATMLPGALYRYRVRIELCDGSELLGYGNRPDDAEDAAYEMAGAGLNPSTPDVGDHRQMAWQLAMLTQRARYA